MARHCILSEKTPIRTSSSSSSVKHSRSGFAKTATSAAKTVMPTTQASFEKRNASFTRSKRLAPHE